MASIEEDTDEEGFEHNSPFQSFDEYDEQSSSKLLHNKNSDHSPMERMSISSRFSSNINNAYSSLWRIDFDNIKDIISSISQTKYFQQVVSIVIFLLVVIFASILLYPKMTSTNDSNRYALDKRGWPSHLRILIRQASSRARKDNSLLTKSIVPPKIITDHGVEFIVSYLIEPTDVSSSNKNLMNMKNIDNNVDGENAVDLDPLNPATASRSLVVSPIGQRHTLLLNKFNTIDDHSLLVTNDFEPQSDKLSTQDFSAWSYCIEASSSIGFFNSHAVSGASQQHKHMQLIPLDSLAASFLPETDLKTGGSGYDSFLQMLPLDKLIQSNKDFYSWEIISPLDGSQELSDKLYQAPEFQFRHGIALLMTQDSFSQLKQLEYMDKEKLNRIYIEYIESIYLQLLAAIASLDEITGSVSAPYNLILSKNWMFAVPRTQRDFEGIVSINAFGFLGMLLAHDRDGLKDIIRVGPLKILKAVSMKASGKQYQ